jgi:hypothetical protein
MANGGTRWAAEYLQLRAWLIAHGELVAALAGLLCTVLGVCYHCREVALYAPTFHLDGAFQTASSLERLANGEMPGRNFLPYLGLGPLLLLFPTFALLGGNLAASTAAAWFTVQLCAGAALAISFFLAARPVRAWHALLPGVALLWAVNIAPGYLPRSIMDATDPGNSLRPLRAFAPYALALLVAVVTARPWSRRRRLACLGAACVLVSLWSNDYGIPSAALFGALVLGFGLRPSEHRRGTLSGLALGAAFGVVLGFLVTGGRLDKLLRYNLVDVVRDQWWLFFPWGAEERVLSARDLIKILTPDVVTAVSVVVIASIRALLTRRIEDAAFALVGASSFLGGLVPSVGGHIEPGYFIGLFAWKYMAVMAWCLAGVRFILKSEHPRAARLGWQVALGSGLLMGGALLEWRRANFIQGVKVAERNDRIFYVPELGGYLGSEWSSHVAAARAARGMPAIDEYWSIWSAVQASQALTPVDSIIHALGSVRNEFSAALARRPPQIITTRASYSDWQSWNVSANWWFYRELFLGYLPTTLSPTTIEWRPALAVPWNDHPCAVSSSPPAVMVRGNGRALYEITLHYRLDAGGRRSLLRVRNNINRQDAGYLSIDPKAREVTFPALVAPGTALDLVVVVAPDRPTALSLESCTAQLIPFSHPEVLRVDEYLLPGQVTDLHWLRGIARNVPSFFVELTPASSRTFVAGRWVHFADGNARRIVEAEHRPPYLNLTLEGALLDGERVGYPRRITVSGGPEPEPNGAVDSDGEQKQVSF